MFGQGPREEKTDMGNRLYVGNLAFHTTEDTLKDHFAAIGGVTEAVIVLDRMTGRSRGFGFVTMESDDLAKRAAAELNNSTLDGRNLKVNEAEERREGGGGRGGFGGGRGGGGGGGGGRGGRFRRAEEITNRVGAFFGDIAGPATDGDKVADLATTELVRNATSQNQLTVLYLVDLTDDEDVRGQFERQVFAGDEIGIELHCFHCGRIDLAKEKQLKERYAKKAPLFVVYDQKGKETEVPMAGYKASATSLQKALEKAANGTIKPSLAAFAKQYGGIVRDLEQVLNQKKTASEKAAKAGDDKQKRAEAEKDIADAEAEQKKLLDQENELLGKMRLPERAANAQRLGGFNWGGGGGGAGAGGGGKNGGKSGGKGNGGGGG